jgi:hypothetical protein
MEEVVLPIRVAHALGCHSAVLTNAAGGINHGFHLGDLMLITGVRWSVCVCGGGGGQGGVVVGQPGGTWAQCDAVVSVADMRV